jgi:hypothetical protein
LLFLFTIDSFYTKLACDARLPDSFNLNMNVLLVALMCIRMVHGQSSSTSSFSTANVTSTSAQPTPPSTTVTPTTISTTTEACPSSLCANAPTTCNYQSNEDYACLSLALCLGGFEADFTPGPCNGKRQLQRSTAHFSRCNCMLQPAMVDVFVTAKAVATFQLWYVTS